MADQIQLLPDHVANQIAAGEVVQRPASVVKELLENAIDANASKIQLILKNAGKLSIQVVDNGKGMSVTDARMSFERHATSKIAKAEDLFNLHTKGFRGEALASIAAIAHVELKTKQEADEIGTFITIKGSKVTAQEAVVTPNGTSISVKNLFYNIPARRNFLKSDTVEYRHVINEFHRVALAHPNISFKMYHNDSEIFSLATSNFRQRIVSIFGSKMNEKLVPINETTNVVNLSGFIGKPEYAKKSKGEQFFFVNQRFIKSSYLNHAINAAFEGLLQPKTNPSYFLHLEVNPASIDINIHPTKTEIKFDNEQSLYAILRAAVKHSLGLFNIAPLLDFDKDASLETPYAFKNKSAAAPTIEVDKNFNPFATETNANTAFRTTKKTNLPSWESLYVDLETEDASNSHSHTIQVKSDENKTPTLFAEEDNFTTPTTYQIQNKYILCAIKSGTLVLHQNRAHQRILYEEYLKNATLKQAISQEVLFPIDLPFNTPELTLLKSMQTELEHMGFGFKCINNTNIALKAIPTSMNEAQIIHFFEQLCFDRQNEIPSAHLSTTDLVAKTLSKSVAIPTGKKLAIQEQEYIVNSLFACKEPNFSPDNKPTFTTLRTEELDKKFN